MQQAKPKHRPSHNFIWGYKTDLSEINHRNARLIWHNYFQLTTKKIVLMALMLALNIVVTVFSRYVMGLAMIGGFFVLELSFFTILMFLLMTNLFYTVIFLEITIWFRLSLGSEPVGLLAMNLVDGFFLIIFALLVFVFKMWAVKVRLKNPLKKMFYWEILMFLVVTVLAATFAVFLNWLFLLRLYIPGITQNEIKTYLPWLFGLNSLKFLINGFIYFLSYKSLVILLKRYQI